MQHTSFDERKRGIPEFISFFFDRLCVLCQTFQLLIQTPPGLPFCAKLLTMGNLKSLHRIHCGCQTCMQLCTASDLCLELES